VVRRKRRSQYLQFRDLTARRTFPHRADRAAEEEPGEKKLVVYDFDVTEQYRTVALILGEALREEVFKLKQFVLVNRRICKGAGRAGVAADRSDRREGGR